jgi:sialate O-acetylesterase
MRLSTPLILMGFLASTHLSEAQNFVRLGAPFGDHMVLQHDVPIVLWGTGCPGGDTIKIYIAGQTASASSDWQGRWEVSLQPMKAGGPYQMLIEIGGAGPLIPSPAANARGGVELNDIMVGEVVLASSFTNAQKEPVRGVSSPHPFSLVRVFGHGADWGTGQWKFVWQDSIPAGSASLFRLGANLAARLQMPVGIIETSNGMVCSDAGGCASDLPQPLLPPGGEVR